MNFAYIGPLNHGGTCLMRGKMLQQLLPGYRAHFIDTLQKVPFFNRAFQSLAFRYKCGPLIYKVNTYVQEQIQSQTFYNFIWVDKAIYLTPQTTRKLKIKTDCLIHYTPDPAFTFHKSKLFLQSINLYDYAITSKSYELSYYKKYIGNNKTILISQGFDKKLHRPTMKYADKLFGVVFIGHCEKEREELIQILFNNSIPVCIAGKYWKKFYKKNQSNSNLTYLGEGVFGEEYIKTINKYKFGLGLISKWIPELHTTRTFEIPACGTALITEKNSETLVFFNSDEAIFYDSPKDMVEKILYYKNNSVELQTLAEKGRQRIVNDGKDYGSILKNVLEKIRIIPQKE